MSEMEKAQILHSLKENFSVSDEMLSGLLSQIKDKNLKNNFSRITKGLKVEDNYKLIFSSLPWVKSINALHQEQAKRHKEKYQVPDYSLLVENSQKENFPLLVDVKSVKGKKLSCTIIPRQRATLLNYARDYKVPLVIAIYWEQVGYWTHNTLKNFTGKKKNKLRIEEAIKNDLSHILSDYSYFIDKKFSRKIVFEKNNFSGAAHKKYGKIKNVYIGKDHDNLEEYSEVESLLIDSYFKLNEVSLVEDDEHFTLEETYEGSAQLIKVSNWLVNFFTVWKYDYSTKVDGVLISEYTRIAIVNLMHNLDYQVTYQIPDKKNKETKRLFELAYKDTYVMNNYNENRV